MDGSTAITRGLDRKLSRRGFIVAGLSAAGGLAIGIAIPGLAKALPLAAEPWSKESAPPSGEINAWILIEPDDSVVVRFARSEIGQGSFTALPMIVTEELECDWSKVKAEYASANRNFRENAVYGRLGTGGSRAAASRRALRPATGTRGRVNRQVSGVLAAATQARRAGRRVARREDIVKRRTRAARASPARHCLPGSHATSRPRRSYVRPFDM